MAPGPTPHLTGPLLSGRLLWVVVLLLALLGAPTLAFALDPIRIGTTREADNAPLLVALDAGYFQAERLEPHVTFFANERAAAQALAASRLDVATASLDSWFYRDAAAHGLRMIASRSSEQTHFPMSALLVSAKAHAAGVTRVAGLAGARIGAVGVGSSAEYAIVAIARRFGLDPGSIRTVALPSRAAQIGALARGTIDAALLSYPDAMRLGRPGESLLRLSDFVQWQQGVVFTDARTIAQRRVLVERFVRGYQRGTSAYKSDFLEYDDGGDFIPGPGYVRELEQVAHEVRLMPALLAVTKTYCDRRANLDVPDIERQVQYWKDRGQLDPQLSPTDLIDASFIGEETVAAHDPAQP